MSNCIIIFLTADTYWMLPINKKNILDVHWMRAKSKLSYLNDLQTDRYINFRDQILYAY